MFRWLARARRWRADHERAWSLAREPGPDGLSPFQRQCQIEIIATPGCSHLKFETQGEVEHYLFVETVEPALTIYIYLEGVELHVGARERRIEEWDTLSPEEMIQKTTAFLREHVSSRDGAGP